jgi:hypothetical protein
MVVAVGSLGMEMAEAGAIGGIVPMLLLAMGDNSERMGGAADGGELSPDAAAGGGGGGGAEDADAATN